MFTNINIVIAVCKDSLKCIHTSITNRVTNSLMPFKLSIYVLMHEDKNFVSFAFYMFQTSVVCSELDLKPFRYQKFYSKIRKLSDPLLIQNYIYSAASRLLKILVFSGL